jgi:hypothetical protein
LKFHSAGQEPGDWPKGPQRVLRLRLFALMICLRSMTTGGGPFAVICSF